MKYKTIVADPPWRYKSKDITTRNWHKSASVESESREGHYTTMTNAEIAALPVADLADKDASLYLWITNPRMFGERDGSWSPYAIAEAWGFKYKTMLTWVKTGRLGLGFYFRGQTEHVLYCTRGNVKIPPAQRQKNVVIAQARGHSEKPDAFFDLVEMVSPGPYLEMFSRRARLGWDTWGNEALGGTELLKAAA